MYPNKPYYHLHGGSVAYITFTLRNMGIYKWDVVVKSEDICDIKCSWYGTNYLYPLSIHSTSHCDAQNGFA